MSVHTVIQSQFRTARALEEALTAMGATWEKAAVASKWWPWHRWQHGYLVTIGGERMLVGQARSQDPFVFQSERSVFRDHRGVEQIANLAASEVERLRREREERERAAAEARRRAAEVEALRHAAAEQERRAAAEEAIRRNAAAEAARQSAIGAEADAILARMRAEQDVAAADRRARSASAASAESTEELGDAARVVVGRLHQAHARERIRDQEKLLQEAHGLYLESEQVTEDGVIELRFRG